MLNHLLLLYISLISTVLLGYSLVLGFFGQNTMPAILFFPFVLYIIQKLFYPKQRRFLHNLLIFLNIQLSTIITIAFAVTVSNPKEAMTCLLILPFPVYFWQQVFSLWLPTKITQQRSKNRHKQVVIEPEIGMIDDQRRRTFLRWLAQAGLGMVLLGLWEPKKAEAAFFGSIPGPGTVALKDSNDTKIDPAVKQPTDGYSISEVDDSTSPAYFGFVNKEGAWYVMKDAGDGTYRYVKGDSDFGTSWTGRADLTYGTFDSIF